MSHCRQLRRKFVRFGGPGLASKGEWVTEECSEPLYSVQDHAAQKCKACRNGHYTAHNMPAEPTAEIEFDPLGSNRPTAISTWANCPWFRPWMLSNNANPEQLHVASRLGLKAKLNPWFTRKV